METVAAGNNHDGNAISADKTLNAGSSRTCKISDVSEMHSTITDSDLEDTNCIPDTQLVQSSHNVTCLPATVSSPDVEMIPDTPDNASSIRVPKTFHRSYLASRSNLLAACDGNPQKKTSPPRRKTTKARSRFCQHTSLLSDTVPEEYADVMDSSPNILQHVFASNLPYPSCGGLSKRCATDPLPSSKRSDHKVTPTKPVALPSGDTVYGTVPSRLFQEALNREKHQQATAAQKNKENLKPNTAADEIGEPSLLDSDPLLLEVLGELKVDSPKSESAKNIPVTVSSRVTDSIVCPDITSHASETAGHSLETLCQDDDLEDILGELRRHNGIDCSVSHSTQNNAQKNQSSLRVNDARNGPSLLSAEALCSDSVNVVTNGSLARTDESAAQLEARDLTFTDLKSEEQTNDSARNSTEKCLKGRHSETADVAATDGGSAPCVQSMFDDVSDSKLESEMSFSETCDQNARYISDNTLLHYFVNWSTKCHKCYGCKNSLVAFGKHLVSQVLCSLC